jgi:hypothetical protein
MTPEDGGPPPQNISKYSRCSQSVTFREFLGDDFPAMARNQVINLAERRIRTPTFIARA